MIKQVIFQIQFANLFFIESKIPDLQLKVMNEFPESALILNQPIFKIVNENTNEDDNNTNIYKSWQFKNNNGYEFTVAPNSFSVSTIMHKSYENSENGLRNVIEFCLNAFKSVIELPFVNRIGLRYINVFPIDKENYESNYNTALNTDKFKIDSIDELLIKSVKKINDNTQLIYHEVFNINGTEQKEVTFDFDAFSTSIKFSECLNITDKLHEIIVNEYKNTIKQQ